jgi:hypothetical protein
MKLLRISTGKFVPMEQNPGGLYGTSNCADHLRATSAFNHFSTHSLLFLNKMLKNWIPSLRGGNKVLPHVPSEHFTGNK